MQSVVFTLHTVMVAMTKYLGGLLNHSLILAATKNVHANVDVAGYIHPQACHNAHPSQTSPAISQAWTQSLSNTKVK